VDIENDVSVELLLGRDFQSYLVFSGIEAQSIDKMVYWADSVGGKGK
jgi:hypothetical protein